MSLFITGCGGAANDIARQYPLEDVVYGDAGYEARVYRAADSPVPQVVRQLSNQDPPVEVSKEDSERMFMVYNDRLIHVMKDAKDPADSLIEVAQKEFVRSHYDLSILETYAILDIVDDMFDLGVKYRRYKEKKEYEAGYGGYVGTGGGYARYGGKGSVRYGSVHGPNPRGGGPGTGK